MSKLVPKYANIRRSIRYGLSVTVLLALAGCSDTGAVQSISTRLGDASHSWNDVASELRQSCERTRQFNAALTDCERPATAGQSIAAVNSILDAYFAALADASADRNFTIAPGLGALGTSAARIPGIDVAQVKAATDLTDLLARIATGAARERTLRGLIVGGVPAARALVGALRERVPAAVAASLSAERDAVSFQFALYIQQGGGRVDRDPTAMCAAGPSSANFSSGNFLLALEYCRRIALIDGRSAALVDYRASLDSADRALADLASSATRLKNKAVADQLFAIGRELDVDIRALAKAFG